MDRDQFLLHAQLEDSHWWFRARRFIVTRVLAAHLPPSPATRIVEIGVGTGGNLRELSELYSCTGIDISELGTQLARERVPRGRILHGDALSEHADWVSQADGVLLLDVLEHIEDDRAFLAAVVSLMKPGAILLLTVPADPKLWSPHDVAFGHFRRYERTGLARLWSDLPVTPRVFSHFNSRLYPLILGIRTMNRWRNKSSGAANTDFRPLPRFANDLLARIMAGEGTRVLASTAPDGADGYRVGVSLLAVLQKRDLP